jgi:hypothetical protein
MLVLLIAGICGVNWQNDLRLHDIHAKFHNDCLMPSRNIKVNASTVSEAVMLVLTIGGFMTTPVRSSLAT